jgi:tetratricopeptide (TPR) repeat protein
MGGLERYVGDRWQAGLGEARTLMASARYSAAARVLEGLLAEAPGLPDARERVPVTMAWLGECYFQCGKADRAIAPFESALASAERGGDPRSVAAYLGSLYEAHRYLGHATEAATFAGRLADLLDRHGDPFDASRFRRQARIVAAGEPPNRVVVDMDGREYELDDLPEEPGEAVGFRFERNRVTLRPAEALVERGRKLGAAGRHAEALDAYREAARVDAYAPEPGYAAALTLLRLRRYDEALASYRETEALAPGWHDCRAGLWLAARLAAGELPHEVFTVLRELEETKLAPGWKAELAREVLAVHPDVPPLYLLRAVNLEKADLWDEAQEAYLSGLTRDPEPDVRTRLLVGLALTMEPSEERTDRLVEARDLAGNLVAAAMAVVALTYSPR